MRLKNFTYRRTRLAATLVAAIACAQPSSAEEAPLTPLRPQPAAAATDDAYHTAAEAFRTAKWAAAAEEFARFLVERSEDPRAEAARFYLAESLLRAGRHAEAAAEFRTVLKSAKDATMVGAAQFRYGEAHYLARSYADAIAALERFVADQPSHPAGLRARNYLFEAYYAAGDYERAEAAAAYFTALYPDDAQTTRAALLQTAALLQLGRYREADVLLVALEADAAADTAAIVQDLLATRLFGQASGAGAYGNWEKAERLYLQFLQQYAKHALAPQAAFELARVTSSACKWNLAAERFALAIERGDLGNELTPQAWLGRVQALAQNRDWPEVLTVAAEAKQKLPNWSRLYEFDYLQGRAHLARAEMNEARTAFGRVLSSTDAAGTQVAALAQYMIAETHFLQRRYDAALLEYRRATDHKYALWQAAAWLQSGKCCEQLQRQDEARDAYDTVLREFADMPSAAEARTRREACIRAASAPAGIQRK